jgi:hypothetical protein
VYNTKLGPPTGAPQLIGLHSTQYAGVISTLGAIKQKMKTILLILSFLIPISYAIAIGLGDWERDTPFGNKMYDAGSGTNFVFKSNGQEIKGINKWYFYRGHTIGEYGRASYFTANEQNSTLKTFDTQQEWENEIIKLNLKPFWARWYQDDWYFLDDLLLIMVFTLYISIPLLIAYIVVAVKAIGRDHLNLRKPYTLIFLGVT